MDSPPPNKPLLFSSIGAIRARLRTCRASRDTRVAREYAWNEKNMKVVRRNSIGATTLHSTDVRLTGIDSFAFASVCYESREFHGAPCGSVAQKRNAKIRRCVKVQDASSLKRRCSASISNVFVKFHFILYPLFRLIFKMHTAFRSRADSREVSLETVKKNGM